MYCPLYIQHDLADSYGETYAKNACALCAMACASSIACNDSSITPVRAINDGVATKSSPAVKNWSHYCTISSTKSAGNEASGLRTIHQEINDGSPVIIQLSPSHYVVGYHALINSNTSAGNVTASDIYVMDPWAGYRTLEEVYVKLKKSWNGYKTVR